MSRFRIRRRMIVMAGLLLTVIGFAGPQTGMKATPATQTASANPWTQRLESLRPDQPNAYFDLAEEIADSASTADQKALAKHLFALAGALDQRRLGRSACLALADLEENGQLKRRLLALSALLDSGGVSAMALPGIQERNAEITSAAALAASDAIGRYRRGQGAQALSALKRPGATELLTFYSAALPGGIDRFLEDCKQMRGTKPPISDGDFIRLLRLEELLLSGAERSWSTELNVLGKGDPLLEIDPDHLEETFGVDARRATYRGGRWVEK